MSGGIFLVFADTKSLGKISIHLSLSIAGVLNRARHFSADRHSVRLTQAVLGVCEHVLREWRTNVITVAKVQVSTPCLFPEFIVNTVLGNNQ